MFKLRDIVLPNGYTTGQLANALMDTVVYTYGDRFTREGADIATVPGEGESDTGVVQTGRTAVFAKPDATMLITDYATAHMGVVPFSTAESQFVAENSDLMADIATLLGYTDYVVYQYTAVHAGSRMRFIWFEVGRDFTSSTDLTNIRKVFSENSSHGMWTAPGADLQMYKEIAMPDMASMLAPNAIVIWDTYRARVPFEYYITDMQNVQDAARQAVAQNAKAVQQQIEVITTAFGSMADLVGNLSVFGNTVKDVANRYNNVSQYIPRP